MFSDNQTMQSDNHGIENLLNHTCQEVWVVMPDIVLNMNCIIKMLSLYFVSVCLTFIFQPPDTSVHDIDSKAFDTKSSDSDKNSRLLIVSDALFIAIVASQNVVTFSTLSKKSFLSPIWVVSYYRDSGCRKRKNNLGAANKIPNNNNFMLLIWG